MYFIICYNYGVYNIKYGYDIKINIMKENDNVLAISAVHRIMLISLLILQCALFIISNVLLTHFHTIMLPWITYTSMIEPQGQ